MRLQAALGVTTLLAATTAAALTAPAASAAPGCKVDYTITNQWNTGFGATVAITNLGDSISGGWTLEWEFPGDQQVGQGWNGQFSQQANRVTVSNPPWGASLATGATVSPGFNGTFTGTNDKPATFKLNGVTCNGTTTPPTDPPPGNGARVDNPYVGAKVYVNPDWSARAAAEPGGSAIANQPTGVWMDRIAAINGTTGARGLRAHLDEAVQQAGGSPLVFQVVIYNLPGRDCSALASNGELKADELPRYKTEYIDPIAAILGDSKYADLRIVTIIEIDSLPNLITNVTPRPTAVPQCDTMKANGNYVNGVGYALAKLGAIPNVYNYVDAGHHGWLGWDDNFSASAQIMAQAARASGSTVNNVHGFIANTANYSALREPYFTINDNVNGQSVRQSKWVDWNRYTDELSYAKAFREETVRAGFPSNVGMLIDTSRNGWGGSARPTGPGPTTSVDAYVNGGRVDRRIHLGNWCNQAGAGLGERPKAAPEAGIDAYVWIKPPGESDGSSKEIANEEGKGFDRMCDPTYTGNPRNNNNMSGAKADAPLSGHWFSAQFQELLRNAYPPL
ncbi:glycoside hydrolase family 6 protein [Kibdelosporangium persicum]|uniref:Glucanase n=1 Tax=Kibdelosporangium persicum TaxID=2698649 RepID=A0ABX2EZM7_9PSEU|nr:glycoside hydrolase family 6 protein [Kibdelosporangium persicum]NRN64474.1 Cellulose 1,4-beta-cellobiosidase [Kibdelosporangium persicum]